MVDVIMPKMGESIIEGTVLEWKKSASKISLPQLIFRLISI